MSYVAIVGGANVDIGGIPTSLLRSRDSNPGSITTTCGGVARNVAEDLARLGVDSRLITLLGNDQYGEMIIALGRIALGPTMRRALYSTRAAIWKSQSPT